MPEHEKRSGLFRTLEAQRADLDEARDAIRTLAGRDSRKNEIIRAQATQIRTLASGLQALTSALGPEASRLVTTAMTRTADVQNPAQPVPEPPAQPPAFTTQDAKTPEAMESPQNPGLVPGSTNDVAADATTTVYQPGADIEGPALKNLIDVTTPVDGTQGPLPLDQVRTLTDVRVGDPNNQSQAFPLRGDFAQRQQLNPGGRQASLQHQASSGDSTRRAYACLRLVEARESAGIGEGQGSKYTQASAIERDASLSTDQIEREIETLEKVAGNAPAPQQTRGMVPRAAASNQRAVPSMQSTASHAGEPVNNSLVADAELFMD